MVFRLALAGVGAVISPLRARQTADAVAQPTAGDRLVFASGRRAGQRIAPADVTAGGPPILAFTERAAAAAPPSRLAQVVLVRMNADELSGETSLRAVDGIVAYSAVCTHTGCDVNEWDDVSGLLLCPCHESRFDPRDAARVKGGPAPRALAAVPLQAIDGVLAAAGGFVGRIGASEIQ